MIIDKIKNLKNHQIILKLRTHNRVIIISLFLLFFLVMAIGGCFLSQKIWNNYEISYSQSFNRVKTDIDNAILPKSADKLNRIIKFQASLAEDVKTYCVVSPLVKWQSIIGWFGDKVKACDQKKERVSDFLTDLGELAVYLKAEQQLSGIIALAKTKTDENNQADKWVMIEAIWRQAVIDVSKIPDTNQFKTIKKLAGINLAKLADAWQKLSSTNLAENRQEFEEAHTNLNQSYSLLAEISASSTLQAKSLIADVNNSYKNIK